MTENSRLTRAGRSKTELSRIQEWQDALDALENEADELRASRERIVRAADHERRQLERELHDGPQQDLIALAVNVQLARDLLGPDARAAAELLDEMARDVQRALETIAGFARRIYPPLLEAGGLPAALRAAAVETGVRTEIRVAVAQLPPVVAGAIYFCWLDALQGTRDGGQATISVVSRDGVAIFEIGGGAQAPPDEVLTRMRDRIEAIGGEPTSETSPNCWAVAGRLRLPR